MFHPCSFLPSFATGDWKQFHCQNISLSNWTTNFGSQLMRKRHSFFKKIASSMMSESFNCSPRLTAWMDSDYCSSYVLRGFCRDDRDQHQPTSGPQYSFWLWKPNANPLLFKSVSFLQHVQGYIRFIRVCVSVRVCWQALCGCMFSDAMSPWAVHKDWFRKRI